ncbi:MAG: RND family transporter [Acutalibacteraceae bacterium]
MIKLSKAIVKHRLLILIIAAVLIIPSVIGMAGTRINYDMLSYLPDDIETIEGQDILLKDFGKGAFSFVIVDGMEDKDISKLRGKLEKIDNVDSVIWYDSLMDISVPKEVLPDEIYNAFNSGDSTVMAVFFKTSTSADETMQAIKEIRKTAGKSCFVTGMSAVVTDLKDLCEHEEPIYVGLAVLLCCAAMMLFMDNWIVPFVFLLSIGSAILLNLGTNYFLGEISYITKALAAVLQLAVTMDYSIFLWHSYEEQKARYSGDKQRAMAHAIKATISSVFGSSVTTIAGFIALCFMSYTLGLDLGVVMAKGVLLGLIGCITTLPALILVFDKLLEKTMHKPLMPPLNALTGFVVKRSWIFILVFALLVVPASVCYNRANKEVYYDMTQSIPDDMECAIANSKLKDEFAVGSTHMLLVSADTDGKSIRNMMSEMEKTDGVKYVLGVESVVGSLIPEEVIPDSVKNILQSENWKLYIINSEYTTASDEVNAQISELNKILKKYDESGMLIGEAPCTKDMIDITNHDFQVVNAISIAAIFIIIAIVLKSVSLPIILVAVIELAIFINLGIPHLTGTSMPFIAPICISTIQLGSTVDYAILMTTRYKRERSHGEDKRSSVATALKTSIPSITVSALGFFAATFGVAVYSDVDLISSLCNLMARGAIISMFCVIFILPAMFMLFDKVICATSIGFKPKNNGGNL